MENLNLDDIFVPYTLQYGKYFNVTLMKIMKMIKTAKPIHLDAVLQYISLFHSYHKSGELTCRLETFAKRNIKLTH